MLKGNLNKKINFIIKAIIKLISGNGFFVFVIFIYFINSLWIALSIRFPMLFDELFHFGVIDIYSKKLSPFLINQPNNYDMYGALFYGNATLYHYFLSYPYRVIASFSNSQELLIIILRILNILMVAVGLFIYSKFLGRLGLKQIFINIGILLFILIPIVPFVSATISYDNLLFPFTALFIYIGIIILSEKTLDAIRLIQFILIGMLASLIKFTFLPVLVTGALFISIFLINKYKRTIFNIVLGSFNSKTIAVKAISISMLILVTATFSYRFITPIIKYGSPLPSCDVILNEQRCLSNAVYRYEQVSINDKLSRIKEPVHIFFFNWVSLNLMQLDTSAAVKDNKAQIGSSLPVIGALLYFGSFLGVVLILYQWKSFRPDNRWRFVALIVFTIIASVFIFNYLSYSRANLDLNTQVRYLLTAVPILLVFAVYAANLTFGSRKPLKLFVLIFVLVLATQGGGAVKHLINSNEEWYWQNQLIIKTNNNLKDLLLPLVKE